MRVIENSRIIEQMNALLATISSNMAVKNDEEHLMALLPQNEPEQDPFPSHSLSLCGENIEYTLARITGYGEHFIIKRLYTRYCTGSMGQRKMRDC